MQFPYRTPHDGYSIERSDTLTPLIFTLFIVGSFCFLLAQSHGKGSYLRYPFLAVLTFGGFAIPQIISLTNFGFYPGRSLDKFIWMSVACMVATYIGFRCGKETILGAKSERYFFRRMHRYRVRYASLLYIGAGIFFTYLLFATGADFSHQYWEGPWVIYLFLANMIIYSLVMEAEQFLRTKSWIDAALLMPGAFYLLLRVIGHGRRLNSVLLFIIVLGLLWFRQRKSIPIFVIIAIIAGGLMLSTSIHAYRMAVANDWDFNRLSEVSFFDNFIRSYFDGPFSDILNGCYIIETADSMTGFDFGAYNWNHIVKDFIPRQIVGDDFKQTLMLPHNVTADVYRTTGHIPKTGSQVTGIADSYLAFSYIGCIKFFIIAFILGILYTRAEHGSTIGILLYVLLLPDGLTAFTHGTHTFVNAAIKIAIFFLPMLIFASSFSRSDLQGFYAHHSWPRRYISQGRNYDRRRIQSDQ